MTDQQKALFECGYAAYANGVARERIVSKSAADLRWLRRGWDASKEDNESLREQWENSDLGVGRSPLDGN
jgi:hypothetical protein